MADAENVVSLPQPDGGGYESARFNALRHGVLSRYTVLPWEDTEEYRRLLDALASEHNPQGPTEEHLVEELAGIIWRKRRLRLGEAAAHHRALQDTTNPHQETTRAALVHIAEGDDNWHMGDAIRASDAQTAAEFADLNSHQG